MAEQLPDGVRKVEDSAAGKFPGKIIDRRQRIDVDSLAMDEIGERTHPRKLSAIRRSRQPRVGAEPQRSHVTIAAAMVVSNPCHAGSPRSRPAAT